MTGSGATTAPIRSLEFRRSIGDQNVKCHSGVTQRVPNSGQLLAPLERLVAETRPIQMRVLTMKMRSLIPMIALPLAMAVSVTSSEAQGKGKAQGTEKGGQGKGQGSGKVEKAPIAAPSSKGRSAVQQRGQSQKVSQGRAGGNQSAASERGRSVQHVNKTATGKTLPASANAAPRASVVASAPNRGRVASARRAGYGHQGDGRRSQPGRPGDTAGCNCRADGAR